MSNQMMQFDGPEGQEQEYSPDPDPRYINRDPREQGQQVQQEPFLYGGYRGQTGQPVYGEKLRPRPQKKRVKWWVPLLVTLLVLMLPMMGFLFASHSVTQSMFPPHMNMKYGDQSQTTTFIQNNTQSRTLVIHDNNGSVQIHTGDSGSKAIVIQTNSNGPHFSDRGDNGNAVLFDPSLKDSNSTAPSMTITAQPPSGPFSSVDLDVTVPQGMNVEVDSISGSISANNVTGQVILAAQSGSISVENSQLSGNSTLSSVSGSVHFDGSIAQNGTYNFSSSSGSVDVTLPASSSFHLDARSSSGTVNNEFNTNDVGAQPRPALTIHSDSGSVDLQKS